MLTLLPASSILKEINVVCNIKQIDGNQANLQSHILRQLGN